MSEDVTILTSASQTSLVKTFSGPDLRVQPFAIGKEFNVSEEPVSDLHGKNNRARKEHYAQKEEA